MRRGGGGRGGGGGGGGKRNLQQKKRKIGCDEKRDPWETRERIRGEKQKQTPALTSKSESVRRTKGK